MSARSVEGAADKKNLSKNVLQMKFMQKGKVVVVDEAEEMAKRIKRNKDHWVIGGIEDLPKKLPYEFDTSLVMCEELLPIGRMAFSNFNPIVEKTHKEILKLAQVKCSTDKEECDGISDEEMAERYDTLVNTIGSKFGGKRKQNDDDDSSSDSESDEEIRMQKKRAKRGFLKPKIE